MDIAKIFTAGPSQLVRLPRQYWFEVDSVLIKRVGNAVVLLPRGASLECLARTLAMFEPGLWVVRDQPARADRRRKLRR